MSEEKKQNTSNGSRGHHRRRHHHHKNKGPKNNQAEVNNVQVSEKHPAANESHSGKKNNNSKNNQRSSSADKQSDTFEVKAEDNAIFGSFRASSFSSEKKAAATSTDLSDVRKFSDEELFGTSHLINSKAVPSENSTEIVGVRFKCGGKVYYFDPCEYTLAIGDFAIVDTARGLEFGEVCLGNEKIENTSIVQPLRKVIRKATKEDIAHHESNKQREKEAFNIALEKIAFHKLDMKLVEAQYSFDNTKLLFYFTSAGRVDFRELVRDLASVFKTRIELRQIGIRDEAKMLGGIGMCGRTLCCSRYLSNFAQVSIKMAKEQGLSLNSNKISGNCGRLMCCLNFENQVYLDEIKITPMPGSVIKIDGSKGVVTDANPLTGMIKVHLDGAPEGEKISTHRDKVTVLSRKSVDTNIENDTAETVPEE